MKEILEKEMKDQKVDIDNIVKQIQEESSKLNKMILENGKAKQMGINRANMFCQVLQY